MHMPAGTRLGRRCLFAALCLHLCVLVLAGSLQPRLSFQHCCPGTALPGNRFFANAALAGRSLVVSSCYSSQYPSTGDSVVTVLSTANKAQPVDSAAGWTLVGSNDGERGSG